MSENLLSTTGLSFERLRAFLEIVAARGISRAAKGNPNRQSQLSRQLAELEAFFGAPLVSRGHGVTFCLTETGRNLRAIATQQFAALTELKQSAVDGPLSIRIGAGESLLNGLVVPVLGVIKLPLREMRFTLLNRRSSEIVEGVTEGAIDLGIIRREPSVSVHHCFLGTVGLVVVKPQKLAKLRAGECPFAVMDESVPRGEWNIPKQPIVPGRPIFQCSSYSQQCELVRSGRCAAIIPRFMASDFQSPRFQVEPMSQRGAELRLHLIFSNRLEELRPAMGEFGRTFAASCLTFLQGSAGSRS
jgi:DNA-binding transcriptional LysR family regulator